ncbi:MAG: DNA-3-methyladenine glycosylase I [Spirochaetes bacterium]|nr:DNA-3-methyladenine glycosylase I [Spirochaetota bacterium]MBN2770593.1 DNA-3-methyladenine glycosylase I [Spirochaetota bacterium]
MSRCDWVNMKNPLYIEYHDEEWGVPVYDDRKLFEMLILEGVQAGLTWETVLNRRETYREAYDNFEPSIVANYSEKKMENLLSNSSLIRNRRKISASVKNASVFLDIQLQYGSFSDYLWDYVSGKPIQNGFSNIGEVPASTTLSEKLSVDLKKRGMSFVGPVIIYSFMQAVGLVNDHITNCFRYNQLAK